MSILSNNFYYQPLKIDSVNTQMYGDFVAKEGDADGRGLLVTLTENGLQKDTTGITLNLKWAHTTVAGLQGLDPFESIDLTKGLYKITYPTNMLRKGKVDAFIQIIDSGSVIGSRNIKINVEATVGNDTAIESSNEFGALVSALVEVQGWNARIDDVEQEFIDKANNLDATYPTRLVSVETGLEQTNVLSAEAVSKADAMASGSPKGVYATLALLQAAYPTGTTGAYLVTADGKWYYWSGSAWMPGGVYQATGITDGSIGGEKTNFLVQNVNIFNKNDMILTGYYDDWGGWHDSTTRYSTGFIKVQSGGTYATNIGVNEYLTFYNSSNARVGGYGSNAWASPFVVPATAVNMTISINSAKNVDTMMICKDTLPGTYVPYGFVLSDALDVSTKIKTETQANIDASWVNNIALKLITKNLFDKTKIVTGKEIYSSGAFSNEANSAVTDYIPVSGFTSIYVSGLTAYATGIARNCFFYDANKTPIAGTLQQIPAASTEKQISVPVGAVNFAMSIYQRKTSAEVVNLDTIQIEKGIVKTAYEPYTLGINTISGYDFSRAIPPKTAGKNFLFFGDSITETATVSDDGATYTEGTRQNWPTFSKQYLQMGQMWNYAKSGGHFVDGYLPSGVIRQQLSTQISTAIANGRPADIIVVSAGTNDDSGSLVLSDYNAIMAKTIETLDRTNFGESVRWCFYTLRNAYPNAMCFYATPIQTASKELNQNMIDLIVKLAKRYNFIIIDGQNESGIVREFETVGRYLSDGLHPNTAGQQLMSKLYNRVILNALNDAN